MNRIVFLRFHWTMFIHRITGDIEHPAHHSFSYGHAYWPTRINYCKASFQTLGARHRNRAHPFIAQMLLYLECYLDRLVLNLVFDRQRVVDTGKRSGKFNVHHWSSHLNDFARIHNQSCFQYFLAQSACPPAISSNSLVMLPCRSLLYSKVKSWISLSALSVAFFIDTMRALCSLALASSST